MLMHKILQNHLICAFVAKLKIGAIYALYPESFCDKNLAIRKVFAFCDSAPKIHQSLIKRCSIGGKCFFCCNIMFPLKISPLSNCQHKFCVTRNHIVGYNLRQPWISWSYCSFSAFLSELMLYFIIEYFQSARTLFKNCTWLYKMTKKVVKKLSLSLSLVKA